jgi:hypothetical protein
MVVGILVHGKTISCTVMEDLIGLMVQVMKEISFRTKRKGKGLLFGRIEANMKEDGVRIKCTDKVRFATSNLNRQILIGNGFG